MKMEGAPKIATGAEALEKEPMDKIIEQNPGTMSGRTGGEAVENAEKKGLIEEKANEIRNSYKNTDEEQPLPVMEMAENIEWADGTPEVLKKFPKVAEHINKAVKASKGGGMFGFATKGFAKDTLEFAVKGANKILGNPDKKLAYDNLEPKDAWKFMLRLNNENYIHVEKKGESVKENGTYGMDSGIGGNDNQ
jgi:hypothetical protein